MWLVFAVLVWDIDIRQIFFPAEPIVEIFANLFQDIIWLPIGIFLPFYLAGLARRITKYLILKIGLFLFAALICVFGCMNLVFYFKYLFYLVIPYLAFLIFHIIQLHKARLHVLLFTGALLFFTINYGAQIFPKFHKNTDYCLTVMSYNIRVDQSTEERLKAVELVRQQLTDIVCIQEVNTGDRKLLREKLSDIYPYQLWSERYENYLGGVILSRFPFVEKNNFDIKTDYMRGHTNVNHVVLELNGKKVHVLNCHLFHGAYNVIQFVRKGVADKNLKSKIHRSYLRHLAEAARIRAYIYDLKEPVILCGDFNDTPNSEVYHFFSSFMQNAYAKAGWGLGTTFGEQNIRNSVHRYLKPFVIDFLRIDHVFSSEDFKVLDAQIINSDASDHKPQVIKFSLKNKKEIPR